MYTAAFDECLLVSQGYISVTRMLDPEAFGDFDACRRASLCHCVFIVQVLIWILNVKINVYAYLGTDDMSGGGRRCFASHTTHCLHSKTKTHHKQLLNYYFSLIWCFSLFCLYDMFLILSQWSCTYLVKHTSKFFLNHHCRFGQTGRRSSPTGDPHFHHNAFFASFLWLNESFSNFVRS